MPQRTCGVDGCPKPHRARGLCVTHYNRRYMPDERHLKMVVACAWCGVECLKVATQRYERRFCSLHCRDTWRRRDRLPVLYVGEVIRPKATREQPPQPRSTKRWVAGNCHRCGTAFVAEDYSGTARWCSLTCARRVSKQRRRAVKKAAFVAPVSPRRIYERDGWRCQLCRKKVRRDKVAPHPLAPVLDHIFPLAPGGTHEPSNVQCAHFLCNSIKRDVVPPAIQLMLFG